MNQTEQWLHDQNELETLKAQNKALREALQLLVNRSVRVHDSAIGPGKRFCDVCGLNSYRDTHVRGCPIEQAELALILDMVLSTPTQPISSKDARAGLTFE